MNMIYPADLIYSNISSHLKSFLGLELSDEEKQGWACQQLCIAHHCHMCKGDGKQVVGGDGGDAGTRASLQGVHTHSKPLCHGLLIVSRTYAATRPASANSSLKSFVDSSSVRTMKPHVLKLLWVAMKRGFTWLRRKVC